MDSLKRCGPQYKYNIQHICFNSFFLLLFPINTHSLKSDIIDPVFIQTYIKKVIEALVEAQRVAMLSKRAEVFRPYMNIFILKYGNISCASFCIDFVKSSI
jgi:hypothetical protein